jgi:hypothetical protein
VFYLDLCTKHAIAAGMDDALLTAIGATGKVFGKISTDVDTQATEVMALDFLFEIASTSYSRKAVVPCFRAVEMMLRATGRDLQVRGFRPVSMLAVILPKIASLVPLEVLMEKAGQRVLQTFPAYDLAFEVNISKQYNGALNSLIREEECSWIPAPTLFTYCSTCWAK